MTSSHAVRMRLTQEVKDNKTWKLIYSPQNRSVLKGRWVFKKKLDVNGRVVRDKTRWVDFLQREGVDYNETYTDIIKFITFNILLTLTAAYDWEVDLINVVTTFLYAGVKEQIFVE